MIAQYDPDDIGSYILKTPYWHGYGFSISLSVPGATYRNQTIKNLVRNAWGEDASAFIQEQEEYIKAHPSEFQKKAAQVFIVVYVCLGKGNGIFFPLVFNKTVLYFYISYMDKTLKESSFQEQNEEQQNKTVYEHKINDEDEGWKTQSKIVDMLNRWSKEG